MYDARRRAAAAAILLTCWAAWTACVLRVYFVQLWRTAVLQPAGLVALSWTAAREIGACALVGAGVLLGILGARRLWRRADRTTHFRAIGLSLAALLTYPWFVAHEALAARLAVLRIPHFPFVGEALGRVGIAVVGAALVTLSAFALGSWIVRAIRVSGASRFERAMLSLTLGFGALSHISLALAFAHLYHPAGLAIVICAVLAAAASTEWTYPQRDVPPPGIRAVRSCGLPETFDRAWVILALLAASFAFVAALAPESEFDALWYHLYLPRRWLDAGMPVDVIQEYPALYPLTWELVFAAGLVMGGVVAAKLLHTVCLALLAWVVGQVCRRYTDASPYVAVGLLLTVPTVMWEAGTAYVDLALAMYVAAAAYALGRFIESTQRSWLVAASLEFGLAAATKHLGLIALAIGAVALTAALAQRRRRAGEIVFAVALLGAVALAVPLPWYLRSWRASGNPFFPELYGVFGGGPATRWDSAAEHGLAAFKAHFGRGHGLAALVRLPWDLTVHAALFGGALGPLWLILMPALAMGDRWNRLTRVLAAGTIAYVAVWASPISSYQIRFLVPVAAPLALIGADAWNRLVTTTARFARPAAGLASAGLIALGAMNLPPFMPLHEADRVEWAGWLTHVLRDPPIDVVIGRESEEAYLARAVPSYAAWRYANDHLPPDAVVLTFSGGDQFYSRRVRIPHDSVLARPAVWTARAPADVAASLQSLRVSHLLFDLRALPQLRQAGLPIASPRVLDECVTEYEDRRYRLCRLPIAATATWRR